MSLWWLPPSGRTRRPAERYSLPGELAFLRALGRIGPARSVLLVAYLAILGSLIWLTSYLVTSPTFAVSAVEVQGYSLMAPEQIATASHLAGENVFLVNTRGVQSATLGLRPIKLVDVAFVWPNRPVLSVVERRPAGTWRGDNGAFLVSADGVVLASAPAALPDPVVVDLDRRQMVTGETVDAAALDAASRLLPQLKPLGFRSFEYSSAAGLTAVAEGGFRATFGDGTNLPAKQAALRALLDEASARRMPLAQADLRTPDRLYLR